MGHGRGPAGLPGVLRAAMRAWDLQPAPPVCARGPPARLPGGQAAGSAVPAHSPIAMTPTWCCMGCGSSFWLTCAVATSLWPCHRRRWTMPGTPSFCTRASTKAGATPRLASCFITRLPRCWGATPNATMACAGPGIGPARKKASTPARPPALPLLFALDKKLGIAGGFSYVPDCRDIDRQSGSGAHCGTSFGEDGGFASDGSADSFGGCETSSDGGDGGSGCGGD
jgi:hypothetical protein